MLVSLFAGKTAARICGLGSLICRNKSLAPPELFNPPNLNRIKPQRGDQRNARQDFHQQPDELRRRIGAGGRDLFSPAPRSTSHQTSVREHPRRSVWGSSAESANNESTLRILENGATVILSETPGENVCVSIWFKFGSVTGFPSDEGGIHFLEHVLFKGTRTRSQQKINEWIEDHGAQVNAYTTRDFVCFNGECISEYAGELLRLMLEMLTQSGLTNSVIETEKLTILREAEEVEKIREEVLMDCVYEHIFGAQTSRGQTILGSMDSIVGMSPEKLREIWKRQFVLSNMIIGVSGGFDRPMVEAAIEESLSQVAREEKNRQPSRLPVRDPEIADLSQRNKICAYGRWSHLDIPILYVARTAVCPSITWRTADYLTVLLVRSLLGDKLTKLHQEANRKEVNRKETNGRGTNGRAANGSETNGSETNGSNTDEAGSASKQAEKTIFVPEDVQCPSMLPRATAAGLDNAFDAAHPDSVLLGTYRMEVDFPSELTTEWVSEYGDQIAANIARAIEDISDEDVGEAKTRVLTDFVVLSSENPSKAEELNRQILVDQRLLSLEEVSANLRSLSAESVREKARKCFIENDHVFLTCLYAMVRPSGGSRG